MAKNIDLKNLEEKGLAMVINLNVHTRHIEPNPLLLGDPTPSGTIPYKEGDPQRVVVFEPQTYQKLGIKEDDPVVFRGDKRKWRVVEVAGFIHNWVSVSFALV